MTSTGCSEPDSLEHRVADGPDAPPLLQRSRNASHRASATEYRVGHHGIVLRPVENALAPMWWSSGLATWSLTDCTSNALSRLS